MAVPVGFEFSSYPRGYWGYMRSSRKYAVVWVISLVQINAESH